MSDSKQELKEALKNEAAYTQLPKDEALIEKTNKNNKKFNKKVDIADKLKKISIGAMFVGSSIGANAQEKVVEPIAPENSILVNASDKTVSFNYYKGLERGQYGYKEAKEAAEFVRQHPEGVYAIDWVKENARRSYAETIAITKDKEYFNQSIGIGSISTNCYVYPKTKEASDAMDKAESNALKSSFAALDVDVTFYTIEAILRDSNIPDEKKEELMHKESNEFFKRVEEGRDDRGNNNDRY